MIMIVNLKPSENEYEASQHYYQISTWTMNATKGSKLCPSGDCQYSIENAQFRRNTYTNGYVFEGLLKVSVLSNDTINSKFYPMHVDLDKTAAQERKGQTTEFLEGSIQFGGDIRRCIGCPPDIEYKVDNGTLRVYPSTPVLTLQGVKK